MKPLTSETGISTLNHGLISKHSQKGFTLWELLIVVAIVAITISMMQFSVGLGDNTRDLKRVGKDLGKLFHLLNQEAVFENRNYAISIHDEGFLVLEFNEGKWLQAPDSFFEKVKLTKSQTSELIIDDKIIDTQTTTVPKPHILILASGEMTPFEWRIQDANTNARVVLEGNVLGSVYMTGPEPLS
ncbi:MAG: type II secretion system minor pseudopilin GspH [Pseudomonadota bacterium]